MTLSPEQAIYIVEKNPNRLEIDYMRKQSDLYKAHVTGIGSDDLIKPIRAFERKQYRETRKALGMSNRDVIYRTMMPRDKVYTAKGGVESFNLSTPEQVEAFKIYMAQVKGTQTMKNYIRQNIQPMYDYDPNGLCWIDLNEANQPIPTFKSIHCIYDYEVTNRKPEYVVFELSNKEAKQLQLRAMSMDDGGLLAQTYGALVEPPKSTGSKQPKKIFRVVCDSYDRIILRTGVGKPVIIAEVPNPFAFMGVPGIVVSDIVAPCTKEGFEGYESCLYPSLELLNQMVYQRSLFNVTYARTVYPKEWMQKQPCPTCNGAKVVNAQPCGECKGTGVLPFQQNSDVLILDYSSDVNKSVPNPPMGHVAPDVAGLQFMHDENATLEDIFRYTQWGVLSVRSNGTSATAGHGGNVSGTAFEAQQNEQPMFDKLSLYGNWASIILKFYYDGCGQYMYQQDFIDTAVMMGNRYMIERADATFDRLLKARQGGATKSELLALTMEFLEAKFGQNPIEFRRYRILAIAEPFYHDSIADVLSWDVPEINKLEKIYFDDWQATLTDDYFANLPDDGLEPIVKADLRNYVLTRQQIDNTADTTLYTEYGGVLNVGDNVTVRKVKGVEDAMAGRSASIKEINGRYARLQDGEGNDLGAYDVLQIMRSK